MGRSSSEPEVAETVDEGVVAGLTVAQSRDVPRHDAHIIGIGGSAKTNRHSEVESPRVSMTTSATAFMLDRRSMAARWIHRNASGSVRF